MRRYSADGPLDAPSMTEGDDGFVGVDQSPHRICKRGHVMSPENVYTNTKGYAVCRKCSRAIRNDWSKQNKPWLRKSKTERERTRLNNLARRKKYGVTPQDYAERLKAQGGVCAICDGLSPDGSALAVDHCHASGKVRGLLCRRCNMALGLFREKPLALRRALNYILEGGV